MSAIETKGVGFQVKEPVSELLCQLEVCLAQEITFCGNNTLEYDQTLKGVESLTVDWAIILCKTSYSFCNNYYLWMEANFDFYRCFRSCTVYL